MKESHSLFIAFLFIITLAAILALSIRGCSYYSTPLELRPFLTDYPTMKPSGSYSHGLGILGALLIIVGVSTYSTRKRLRSLWKAGKLSRWLEFHIVLCLLGPVLIIYHTTFKVGGIAAISFWTMISVASSGIIGRFLYTLIPRNLNGNELSLQEIQSALQDFSNKLRESAIGNTLIEEMDQRFAKVLPPENILATFRTLIQLRGISHEIKKHITGLVKNEKLSANTSQALIVISKKRMILLQKSIALRQVEKMFYYWHAIHLPFSIIMFITLVVHVVVVVSLGYRWIL